MRPLFLTIVGVIALSTLAVPTPAELSDQVAREQARNAVRLQLHLEPDQFLSVLRDERLEQLLRIAASQSSASAFIYQVSQAGEEIKENVVVHHISTDFDPSYIIAVDSNEAAIYRVHGFSDSLSEFNRLIVATQMKVLSSAQAEAVSDFFLAVNPSHTSMTPIRSLIELKQAAERQCQMSPFDAGERAFNEWWRQGKQFYAAIQFEQTATPHGEGHLIAWVVLSSSGSGLCGGAPLRAELEVQKDGQVSELKFIPLRPK